MKSVLLCFALALPVAAQDLCSARLGVFGRPGHQLLVGALRLGLQAARYQISVRGLAGIRGDRGIAFFPNHPSRIDPLIQYLILYKRFLVRPLVFEDELNRPGIGAMIRLSNPVIVPSMENLSARDALKRMKLMIDEVEAGVTRGENFLIYPEGQLTRGLLPVVRNTGIVSILVKRLPQLRVVLSQMNGMAGSSFGYDRNGEIEPVEEALRRNVLGLVTQGLFFGSSRKLTVKYEEPLDFPREASKDEINSYLTRFYQDGFEPHHP